MFFHKIIENRLTLSELEVGIVVHKCKIVRERSCRFSCNLSDRPEPRNVKVAVACHYDFTGGGVVDFFNLTPKNVDRFRHRSDKSLAAKVKIELMNRIVHSVEKAGFNVFILAVPVCVPCGRDIKPVAFRQPVNSDKLRFVERVFHIFCACNRTVAEACTVDGTLNLNVELFARLNAVLEKNFRAVNPAEVFLRADCADDLTVDSDNCLAAEINRKIHLFALKFGGYGNLGFKISRLVVADLPSVAEIHLNGRIFVKNNVVRADVHTCVAFPRADFKAINYAVRLNLPYLIFKYVRVESVHFFDHSFLWRKLKLYNSEIM